MITWRLRNLSLKEVHHGTRTLAPIVSPDHGGGTNLREVPAKNLTLIRDFLWLILRFGGLFQNA